MKQNYFAFILDGVLGQFNCSNHIARHLIRTSFSARPFYVAAENALTAKYEEPKTESGKRRARKAKRGGGK